MHRFGNFNLVHFPLLKKEQKFRAFIDTNYSMLLIPPKICEVDGLIILLLEQVWETKYLDNHQGSLSR